MNQETLQKTKRNPRTIAGIILVAGPTALIALSLLLYAIANFIAASTTASNPDDLFGEPTPMSAFINIILFILGALGVIAWLPCLIIGIVLLASKKK